MDFKFNKFTKNINFEENNTLNSFIIPNKITFLLIFNLKTTTFFVILENFRLCLIQRTLEELPDFEVMTWQLCRMLRSALNCFQVTRFCVQK